MKAVLCKSYGPPENLITEETDAPEPGKGEVVIDVKACGLNFPDTLIIEGKYQFQPDMPFSPGSEVSGIVTKIGSDVNHLSVGDHVMAGTGWGGFAEQVKSKASNAFVIPKKLDFITAASSMMTYGTSYLALVTRANLQKGETLLVLGASGGVGTAAIQIGKVLGARVIAAASSNAKLDYCKKIGADETINYSTENLKVRAKELTTGAGVDVIYDPIGDQFSEPALRSIAWNGRYLVIGFAAGDIPRIPLNLPLLKGCSIMGVFWGGFFRNEPMENAKNFETIIQWFDNGKLKPMIHGQYSLDDVSQAMNAMKNREVMGKIVLIP